MMRAEGAPMTLDSIGTLALAAAILLAGRFLNAGVAPLARYNIPQPISGGLAFALLAAALHAWSGLVVESARLRLQGRRPGHCRSRGRPGRRPLGQQ
jgi:hypothetical protein